MHDVENEEREKDHTLIAILILLVFLGLINLLYKIKLYFCLTFAELNTIMSNLNSLMFSLVKSLVILVFIIFMFYSIYWLLSKNEGTYIQPFEVGTCNENYSGRALSDLLISELQRIRQIHEYDLPGIEAKEKKDLAILSIAPSSENPKYEITNVNISSSSFAITLGQILLVLKRLIGHPGNTISGSLQKYGSRTKLVAWMGPEKIGSWQVEREDMDIPNLIKDMAYMIAKDISEEKIQARTWQAFKFFTEALYCYNQYILTDNKRHLECAKDTCLMALEYEREYEDLYILLINLGMAYGRQ
jgi:hypothetical protein